MKQFSCRDNSSISSVMEGFYSANETPVFPLFYNTFDLNSGKLHSPYTSTSKVRMSTRKLSTWNAYLDHFCITIVNLPHLEKISKNVLVYIRYCENIWCAWMGRFCSYQSKNFITTVVGDEGRLWWSATSWDISNVASVETRNEVSLWKRHIPHCHFPRETHIVANTLYGFSDTTEHAYTGIIYIRMTDCNGGIYLSLVMSKMKVAPIRHLTITHLELCRAYPLAQLLHHVQQVFCLSLNCVYTWT